MREIKFRQFIDGKMKFSGMIFTDGSFSIPDLKTHKHPLEQFTGLTDRYDEDIFNGDIIIGSYGIPPRSIKAKVEFEKGCFIVRTPNHNPDKCYLHEFLEWMGEVEVIGNIHENPELI